MDYHSDRYTDHSLMVFKDEKLFAVMPANIKDDILYSHQGLTYGGFVLSDKAKLVPVFKAFKAVLEYLHQKGIRLMDIRIIPTIYNRIPSDELAYILFKADAILKKRDVQMVIDYSHSLGFQKNRREGINKAVRNDLEVREDGDFESFWKEILIPNLAHKHDAAPVHSLMEIEMLVSRFPDHIKQVNVYRKNKIVAGTTVFLTGTTVHPQYVSANTAKNTLGCLDLLYDHIINRFRENRRYFDFNTSSEDDGAVLNEGLLFWKESCGARAFTSDNYLVETASYKKLTLNLK